MRTLTAKIKQKIKEQAVEDLSSSVPHGMVIPQAEIDAYFTYLCGLWQNEQKTFSWES